MRMAFCVDISREKKCSTIAFTNVWHFVTSNTVKANINKLLSLSYESSKKTCELLFWFSKITKRSVEYQLTATRHSVEANTPTKSDSLRNFHKLTPAGKITMFRNSDCRVGSTKPVTSI